MAVFALVRSSSFRKKMAPISSFFVKRRHAWTGSKTPWLIDVGEDVQALLPKERQAGWRLFHYLSGGGIRAFAGSAVAWEVVSRRQTRFLFLVLAAVVVWIVLRFV